MIPLVRTTCFLRRGTLSAPSRARRVDASTRVTSSRNLITWSEESVDLRSGLFSRLLRVIAFS